MEQTLLAYFNTRRDAELAVEHLVQEHGIARADIFLRAQGDANTAGVQAAGADVESGHPGVDKHESPKLEGQIELSVDYHGSQQQKVVKTLEGVGGTRIRAK